MNTRAGLCSAALASAVICALAAGEATACWRARGGLAAVRRGCPQQTLASVRPGLSPARAQPSSPCSGRRRCPPAAVAARADRVGVRRRAGLHHHHRLPVHHRAVHHLPAHRLQHLVRQVSCQQGRSWRPRRRLRAHRQLLENAAGVVGSKTDVTSQFDAAVDNDFNVVRMFAFGTQSGFALQSPLVGPRRWTASLPASRLAVATRQAGCRSGTASKRETVVGPAGHLQPDSL